MTKCAFIVFFLLSSCVYKEKPIVLDYSDFGPQVLSYETLGFSWYEWNSHGSKEKDNVKVIVYKNLKSSAHKRYIDSQSPPAVDYRFISHQKAMDYLNKNIEELSQTNEFPEIIKLLKLTKKKLVSE